MAHVYITDAWVVIGPQPSQRQHAAMTRTDEGLLVFECGQGRYPASLVNKLSRRPIQDHDICKQPFCQRQYAAYIEFMDEIEARLAEEDKEISQKMQEARESLLALERRLVRVR